MKFLLPDVLRPGLDAVFCGTAAGRRSAAEGAYYAHPGNKFWRILFRCGLTPTELPPSRFRSLPVLGLGLTDLTKDVCGNDDELCAGDYDVGAFLAKIR